MTYKTLKNPAGVLVSSKAVRMDVQGRNNERIMGVFNSYFAFREHGYMEEVSVVLFPLL